MTPQELKNSILQLAIQGKLVEQQPEEGSATLLLKMIEKDRSEQIEAKLVKANRKTEPITDEDIPFDIPESWTWIRFGDLVNYSMGKTPPRVETQWWGDGLPWVSIADMPESGHVKHTKESVTDIAVSEKFGNHISKAGTLIMSFKLTVGRVSILDIEAVHNEAIISIYPFADQKNIIQAYLFHILPFVTQYGDSKNAIKGKTLNDTSISNLLIPLPPLAEQKRIVAKIEELLPYIDHYEQAWSRLEVFNKRFPDDMKKSILQLAIQGRLVEQRQDESTGEKLYYQIQEEKQRLIKAGKIKKEKPLPEIAEDEKPFEIPESWKWVRLPTISSSCLGKMLDRQKNIGTLAPYLRNVNVRWNSFDLDDLLEMKFEDVNDDRFLVQKGDLVMCEGGEPGRCAIWEENYTIHFQKALHRIRFYISMVPQYFQHIFEYYAVSGLLNDFFTGTTIKHLTGKALDKIIVPLPPLAEQKRIVDKLEELLPLCEWLK